MTEEELQLVPESPPDGFDDRLRRAAARALVVAELKERNRCGVMTPDVTVRGRDRHDEACAHDPQEAGNWHAG